MRRLLAYAGALAAALVLGHPAAARDEDRAPASSGRPLTLAVIGDSPYGPAQLTAFPRLVSSINADPNAELVLHLGDIKNGSSPCTDAYFGEIRTLFDTFADPLVYTPGDNEWTDCHRPAAGGFLPTERLARIRQTFFPRPGVTLGGQPREVYTQANSGIPAWGEYVENQLWRESGVVFVILHVVGSNNDLQPWFGAAETAAQRAQRLEESELRQAANLAWLTYAFELAFEERAKGVVVAMQADTWDAFSIANGLPLNGFDAIVQRLAGHAREFERPVLVLQGDSHRYLVDRPLAGGDPVHGVTAPVPNLTRIVVEGETASEWLRLRVDPGSAGVFSWERVPVGG